MSISELSPAEKGVLGPKGQSNSSPEIVLVSNGAGEFVTILMSNVITLSYIAISINNIELYNCILCARKQVNQGFHLSKLQDMHCLF